MCAEAWAPSVAGMDRLAPPFAAFAALLLLPACAASAETVELPYADDFSEPCAWDGNEEFSADCDDDALVVELGAGAGVHSAMKTFEPATEALTLEAAPGFAAEVRTQDDLSLGLGCWTSREGGGYVFLVSPAGRVAILAEEAGTGQLRPLVMRGTPMPGFRLHGALRVDCVGGPHETTLALSLDGAQVEVAKVERADERFSILGFVTANDGAESAFRFDDASARELTRTEADQLRARAASG